MHFAANAPPWTNKPSSAYLSMRDLDENLLPKRLSTNH